MKNENIIPIVAIVGRPNVGKSSLFNRMARERHSVVQKIEGTTRDRIEKLVNFGDRRFIITDTGGFSHELESGSVYPLIRQQIENAVRASDMLLFVCDGETGPMPLDFDLAANLRKSGKKIALVVNKIDNDKRKDMLTDFYELGLGEPLGISCMHNIGMEELGDEIIKNIPSEREGELRKNQPIRIAICGRPNVGKSSFLNKIMNEERVLVHDKPGTTRDSVDASFEKDGILFTLIDTAGIRHKKKVKEAVNVYSMMRARESIDRADVAMLLVDGMEGITSDDVKIFDYVTVGGKGCVIAINKWDLVKNIEMSKYQTAVLRRIPDARNFPFVFISAKTGRNVLNAFDEVKAIKTNQDLVIDADTLTEFLENINPEGVRIKLKTKPPRFYTMKQVGAFPKEFLIFVSNVSNVTKLHTSFIENRLRETFPLKGIPVKIRYKRRPKVKYKEPKA